MKELVDGLEGGGIDGGVVDVGAAQALSRRTTATPRHCPPHVPSEVPHPIGAISSSRTSNDQSVDLLEVLPGNP